MPSVTYAAELKQAETKLKHETIEKRHASSGRMAYERRFRSCDALHVEGDFCILMQNRALDKPPKPGSYKQTA
jgi:hypothetical protein